MNFRTELRTEQKIVEDLLDRYASNLWEEVSVDDILRCENIFVVQEYLARKIESSSNKNTLLSEMD